MGQRFSPAATVVRGMLRELMTFNYSLRRISEHVDISPATLRRMLQGATCNPSSRTFYKLLTLYCAICCRTN